MKPKFLGDQPVENNDPLFAEALFVALKKEGGVLVVLEVLLVDVPFLAVLEVVPAFEVAVNVFQIY